VVQKAIPPDFVANRSLAPIEPLEIILDPELGFPFWGWTGVLNANPRGQFQFVLSLF
jgi:hypothetical protein